MRAKPQNINKLSRLLGPKAGEHNRTEHAERNRWHELVGFRECIFPCSGEPMLMVRPTYVALEADDLPAYLKCSNCGCVPGSEDQPELVKRFLKKYVQLTRNPAHRRKGKL